MLFTNQLLSTYASLHDYTKYKFDKMATSQNVFLTWHPSISGQPPPQYRTNPNRNSLQVIQGHNSLHYEFLPCTLCYFQNSGILTKCGHRILCPTCAQKYVTNQIREGKLPRCLVKSCKNSSIDDEGLVKKFTIETQQKLKAAKLKLLLQKQERTSVNRQISKYEGQIDKSTEYCIICKRRHCPLCHRPSHRGECLGINFLGDALQIKTCKACNGRVYKQEGCGRITCPSCHKQICYECGQTWSFHHHSCQQGGWLKLPWNILTQCCTSSVIDQQKKNEVIR